MRNPLQTRAGSAWASAPGPFFLSIVRVMAAAACAAALVPASAFAADLVWTQEDWSDGQYQWATGIEPEIHPGLLVLDNQPWDMRFVSEPTEFRGIYAMAVYHDTLFLGAGPYPITGDGADVLAYDYLTDTSSLSYQPYEQGIISMKVYGDTLYIPGPESRDPNTEPGCIYLYNGHQWIEKQTVPDGVHVYDLEVMNAAVYVTTADRAELHSGSICVSMDWGDTFTRIFSLHQTAINPWRWFYAAGRLQDRVYFQPDGYEPENDCIFAFDGTTWDTLSVPGLPTERMGLFTAWGDSLLLTVKNRMFILHGDQCYGSWLPFSGNRWCRSVHVHQGALYGGAAEGLLYRWTPGSSWTLVTQLGLDPDTEEIEALVTYYGRLFVSTSRAAGEAGGRLYVSSAAPFGRLASEAHDFGVATRNGVLYWTDFRPGIGNTTRLRIRSGASLEELEVSAYVGPDGTAQSYYEDPGTQLPPCHYGHRYFQYTVDLLCPEGLRMPFLSSVTLAVDSLDMSGLEDPEDSAGREGESHGPVEVAALSLWLHSPYPNPATKAVWFDISTASGPWPHIHGVYTVQARLRIVDVQGRLVRAAALRLQGQQDGVWRWDLRDGQGKVVPAGIYRLTVDVPGNGVRPTVGHPVLVLPGP